MEPLLEIKNLSVSFNRTKVLKNLSYLLRAGETLSIAGESGSGKTVHALALMRLLGKTAEADGEVLFKGKNILKLKEEKMRALRGHSIAMIFQDPMSSLNPVFTVGYQIAETLLAHKKADKKTVRQKTLELLKTVEIEDGQNRINRYPHEFSGGQRQRIMIAQALACEPEILIADEPTTALDVTIQKQIISLLKNLQKKRNMALIFITHNLALASELGGRVLVLYAGQNAEEAEAKDIFSAPKHPYTQGLIAAADVKPGLKRLPVIEGAPPAAGEIFAGCPFEPRCPKRMKICSQKNPSVFKAGASLARCFLYE
ncbi:MAG: ABC transporter ATP-binding protein [Elusimicrobium sp.]|jgi:oligopeptide/dipeptide ABC transporter ATP-binding protein|nr:ABC transporter ATP-binding protein [Elusimicrobium sp.]